MSECKHLNGIRQDGMFFHCIDCNKTLAEKEFNEIIKYYKDKEKKV
jgi:hypothetical protein